MLIKVSMVKTEMSIALGAIYWDKFFDMTAGIGTLMLPFLLSTSFQILIRYYIVLNEGTQVVGWHVVFFTKD